MHIVCRDVMKHDVECVHQDDSVQRAAQKMRDSNVGFLPVCDERMKVLGVITDRDISVRLVADNRPATSRVRDVMTREIVACRPTESLTRAEELMATRHKSRVMVLDKDDTLVGVISLSDVAEIEDAAIAAQTLQQVASREARA
jgi:CBS domain-containing protein